MDAPAVNEETNKSSFLRLVVTIIGFTLATVFALTMADRSTVQSKWAEMRCKLPIMMTAFLYKPEDYNGSAADFAADNFNFCMSGVAGKALNTATQPAVGIMQKQVDATGTVSQIQNSIRNMMGNLYRDFAKNLDRIFHKYRLIQGAAAHVQQYLRSAIGKLEGVIGATTYLAISTFVSMMNTIEFIVWVAIIIILILVVIFIILFFFLAPFTPLLLTIVSIITAAGFGAAIGGAASVFCFAEGTNILLKDGSICPIEKLENGSILLDGGKVEGMFVFEGKDTPLYDLYGTFVSGTHLVYNNKTKTYMEVADHPDAHLTNITSNYVYCPITSTRHLPVQNGAGRLSIFCDWEEVDSAETEAAWASMVMKIIGTDSIHSMSPAGFNGDSTLVIRKSGNRDELEYTPIKNIVIGDYILDRTQLVKVLGIVKREVSGTEVTKFWARGTWFLSDSGKWVQNSGSDDLIEGDEEMIDIYHLITTSGTFTVIHCNNKYIVRDATEVGVMNLRKCTPAVLKALNSQNVLK